MNSNALQRYQNVENPLPENQYAWPLYGAGIEKLGLDGKPVKRVIPQITADELLMRIDAVSLCYTDVKEISLGDNHPRLKDRNLQENPIVPGHELSMTVIKVGDNLKDEYKVGQRYTMQPDVWVDGKSVPFSFGMDGAYRQFAVIDHRILKGDAGNYLIPVPSEMTYAAAAITEPWACVEAAYRMDYRSHLKAGGAMLIVGGDGTRSGFVLDTDWVAASKPAKIQICDLPGDLAESVEALCKKEGISFKAYSHTELKDMEESFDDLLLLDQGANELTTLAEKLAKNAVISFNLNAGMVDQVSIDLGRLHYDNYQYVGTDTLNLREAYDRNPARVEFLEGGIAWILGGGGPMGRMHVQRAIESPVGPRKIIVTEVTDVRLESIRTFFGPLAEKYGKELVLLNPVEDDPGYRKEMEKILEEGGVDDVEVMVTIPAIIGGACQYVAKDGMINIFAGMKRGVSLAVDPMLIAGERQVRFIGHSGSGLDDQKAVVDRCLASQLDTNLSVAAIGGLMEIPDGIRAMKDSLYPGKIVIFPQFSDLPLVGLTELGNILPEVAKLLGENDTWNEAAEAAFFESQLS
ncbi:MAG: alcohol dehydrogenase catalytic domain-containing protein [Anaerolineaceae bacterium]|nr:alcohol dehydrogenase catalytic domain-containing protein [Anaerolineaceae bacterium]